MLAGDDREIKGRESRLKRRRKEKGIEMGEIIKRNREEQREKR